MLTCLRDSCKAGKKEKEEDGIPDAVHDSKIDNSLFMVNKVLA